MRMITFKSYHKITPIIFSNFDSLMKVIDLVVKSSTFFEPSICETDMMDKKGIFIYENYGIIMVTKEERIIFESDIAEHICFFICTLIERDVLMSFPESKVFHGSSVERNGTCICIVAPSGFGKSSIVFNLCQKGFGLVSDDLIVVSNDIIIPIPLLIKFRSGVCIDDKSLKYFISKDWNEKLVFAMPPTRKKINTICFVELKKDNQYRALKRLSNSESFLSLLYNLKMPCKHYDTTKEIADFVKYHKVYSLSNVDIDESTKLICSIADD